MGMGFFDKEKNIIDLFRLEQENPESICYMTGSSEERKILESVCGIAWEDTSAKGAPPPDFYNDQYKLMMEVMRVDDCERPGVWRDSAPKIEEELAVDGHFGPVVGLPERDMLPHIITADDGRPSFVDHNYNIYRDNFRRIVGKHVHSVPIYRRNHPGHKLIFFVRDESCLYFNIPHGAVSSHSGAFKQYLASNAHFWMYDRAFLEPLVGADVDFLVWYTPYKLAADEQERLETYLPTVCVYDLKSLPNIYRMDYLANNIWPREL